MNPDFIGRCVDAAIPLIIGVGCLLYYPRIVAKNIKSGKWSEADGRKNQKRALATCGLIILFGILQIIWLFC